MIKFFQKLFKPKPRVSLWVDDRTPVEKSYYNQLERVELAAAIRERVFCAILSNPKLVSSMDDADLLGDEITIDLIVEHLVSEREEFIKALKQETGFDPDKV